MMKKPLISAIVLSTVCLFSATSVIAESMPIAPLNPGMNPPIKPMVSLGCTHSDTSEMLKNVSKVCVFDIDETLVFLHKNPDGSSKRVKAKGATAAVNKCIEAGYGIALATASYPYKSNEDLENFRSYLFDDDMFPQLKKYAECRAQTSYAKVQEAHIKPTYVVGTNGIYYAPTIKNPPPTGANKGQAMDRIMRTYFGMGVGNSFVDENNAFIEKYKRTHGGNLPNPKGLSGCLVLFDDSRSNDIDIMNFNDVYDTNFQFVKVKAFENPIQQIDPVGITEEDVVQGFKKMEAHCKP